MALKKKSSMPREEQLFMLEVFIDRVNLQPERASTVNVDDLIVCVKFNDLPEYEIGVPKCNRDNHAQALESPGNLNDFKFDKSCLFAKTPSSLIKAIRNAPLRLEVYYKGSASYTKKNEDLLGTAKLSLPACMCNQVSTARNETNGLSTPCLARDTVDLTDSNGQTSGTVSVVLRLSCFGSSIVKHFHLNGKSFVLEDSPLQKFLCPYLASKDENASTETPLRRPDSPPRVSINDPGFKQLTMAEKLNDPKFRELVYRAYPDEATCCCQPTDRSTHPMECRSGCTRPCCMQLRNPEVLEAHKKKPVGDVDPSAQTYCVNDFPDQQPPCSKQTRLKGGGDIEQIYLDPTGYRWTDYDTDYTWYGERNPTEVRLEGGGGENDMSSCSCSGGAVPVKKSQSKQQELIAILDACKPRHTSTGPRPACVCAGKDTETWHTGAAKCSKDPCMGVDCLIRAFRDAQEFVDSIGKVPGLPGLGLMDPSESPYFGRDLDKDYVPKEPQPPERKKMQTLVSRPPPSPPCTAACNVQKGKSGDDVRLPPPYTPPAPLGALMLPPRLGIVREAIPVLPDVGPATSGRHRKRDDKKDDKGDKHHDITVASLLDTEMGPCGEPRCKSRRKRSTDLTDGTQSATQISARARVGQKTGRGSKKRRGGKSGKRRNSPHGRGGKGGSRQKGGATGTYRSAKDNGALGPGGDRDHGSGPSITVSRPVMRYVYFVGDHYPGINYGHRDCIDIRMRVPANMGWLWNTMANPGNLKPRIGWRPGAIGRYLYEMLQDAKENSFLAEDTMSTKSTERGRTASGRGKGSTDRGRAGASTRGRTAERGRAAGRGRVADRARGAGDRGKSASGRQRTPSRRRGGRATAAMQREQMTMEDEQEGPEDPPTLHIHRKDGTYYVTMYPIRQETSESRLAEPIKPLQFKIVKNKDDASVASSSTASDMEIEFSPPAAVTRYRKKPDVIHVDTQVRQQEILEAVKMEGTKKKDRRSRRIDRKQETD